MPFTAEQRRGLAVVRGMYLVYYGALGAFWSFQNVYFKDVGLTGVQIGLVNTLSPLLSIFAATLWGVINDRLGRPRIILWIAIPGLIASCIGLSLVTSFWGILIFTSVMAIFTVAVMPLMDNITLRLLEERRNEYGRYRVGGSVGFIVTSLVSGFIYEATGLHAIFPAYIGFMVVLLVITIFLPNRRVMMAGSVWSGLGEMVRAPAWVIFAVTGLLLWIANTATMTFIGITVQEMGGTDSLVGLVAMASAIGEIPVMLSSNWLLKRFGSTRLLVLSLTFFTLRGVLLANMQAPGWAAVINLLGGLSFSLFWVASVHYANEAAPEHLKTTAQGLLFSIMNLASMFGSISAGWLYDGIGFRGLYWTTAAVSLVGLVLFLGGRRVLRGRGSQ